MQIVRKVVDGQWFLVTVRLDNNESQRMLKIGGFSSAFVNPRTGRYYAKMSFDSGDLSEQIEIGVARDNAIGVSNLYQAADWILGMLNRHLSLQR